MFLINITNLDYAMMTILFCILVAFAYKFRRQNLSSADFLLMERAALPWAVNVLSILSVGILEFSLISSYGAYAGLAGLFLALPLYLIMALGYEYFSRHSKLFLQLTPGKKPLNGQGFILLCYALFMLLVAGVAISIVVGLLKSLLGWEFGNSTLSLVGMAMVCMIIGGVSGSYYNQMVVSLVATLILLVVCGLAYQHLGTAGLIGSLQQVAIDNKLKPDYFISLSTQPFAWKQAWLVMLGVGMVLLVNPLIFYKKLKFRQSLTSVGGQFLRWGQLLILVLIFASGVLSLASPSKQTQIEGKKITTSQIRLDSGELGYVVRAVASDQASAQRGLIPLHTQDNSPLFGIESVGESFDFFAAGLVLLKSVLPYAFVPLFIIVLFFFKSLSEALSFVNLILVRGFYASRFNKSGEELENLWAARVFMFTLIVLSVCIGLVFFRYCDLAYLFYLILLLGVPLFLNLCGLSRGWLVDLFAYVGLLGGLGCLKVNGMPGLFKLIYFKDALDSLFCLSSGIAIYYVATSLIGALVLKKR